MPAKPRSYGEAVAKAQRDVNAARLADPDEHFPYKHDHVRALVADNPPMGPDGPSDNRVTVADVMTVRIADASNAYIEAQAAYLTDPGPATKSALDAATDDLVAARRNHRRNRVDADGKPTGAILAVTANPPTGLVHGLRHPRPGEA